VEEIDRLVDDFHLALDAFFKGDPEPAKRLYSHGRDASLNNPFGPPVRGWVAVAQTMDRAAAHYRDGRATGFERVAEYTTAELAYIVEVEHYEAKVGGSDVIAPVDLRVTTVLRPEDGAWKILHRHADPITTARSPESVTQR
jgi:ketosteroid isomerase-like protein